jgi:TRAP-type C4-dicarboxylate transport system permease small subunit
MSRFRKGLRCINTALNWIEGKFHWTYWLYIVLAGLVTWEVIARYILKQPHDWFLEVAILLSVYCGFLGAGTITKEHRHISLDLFYMKASPKTRRRMDIINNTAGVIVSGILTYYTVEQMIFLERIDSKTQSSLAIPFSIQTLGVVLGLLLCTFYFFGRLIQCFEEQKSTEDSHHDDQRGVGI